MAKTIIRHHLKPLWTSLQKYWRTSSSSSLITERIFIFYIPSCLFFEHFYYHDTFFRKSSLKIAQFSLDAWILNRNFLIGPISGPRVPSAIPKWSNPPTIRNPSFNGGCFVILAAFWVSSGRISHVVLKNLSLGCSAFPETNR